MNANDMMEREMFSNNNYLRKDDKNNYQTIKRNYGIDLLRIFSMINIINLHLNLNSGQLSLKSTSSKFYNIWRLEVFSYWAVDCFGLISGIVGYKRYKFSNLIYLWIQVCFYSTSISLILFI
jgi:surface polysaccharide O-acyltransferase-like enzyme